MQINRLRRKIETDPANPLYLQTVRGIGYRLAIGLTAGEGANAMTSTVEAGVPAVRGIRARLAARSPAALGDLMPKGLYARSLIIIITPIVLLQAFVAFVFMERALADGDRAALGGGGRRHRGDRRHHRDLSAGRRNTRRSSASPASASASTSPSCRSSRCRRPRRSRSSPSSTSTLSREITKQIGKPFWIDTVGRSNLVEIRIQLDNNLLRVFARRSQTYASNSLIFISWMVGTSLVLLAIAIIFLRNQIRPILTLADAVDDFGKGRPLHDFAPRGAREVRQATVAFHEMRGASSGRSSSARRCSPASAMTSAPSSPASACSSR